MDPVAKAFVGCDEWSGSRFLWRPEVPGRVGYAAPASGLFDLDVTNRCR